MISIDKSMALWRLGTVASGVSFLLAVAGGETEACGEMGAGEGTGTGDEACRLGWKEVVAVLGA